MADVWDYRAGTTLGEEVVGFDVEALDGHIGKIDESSTAAGRASLVVDTGFWIFGKKRLIPAGVVERIDPSERKVHIGMTKDQVKSAPDWRDDWWSDETTRASYGDYYGPFGR